MRARAPSNNKHTLYWENEQIVACRWGSEDECVDQENLLMRKSNNLGQIGPIVQYLIQGSLCINNYKKPTIPEGVQT